MVSAKEGSGIDALLDLIRDLLVGSTCADDMLLSNARHDALLRQCLDHVRQAGRSMAQTGYVELAAAELHDGLHCIDEILGERIDQEVLSRIFSQFCIGK
jgi:tRNA modification GTPase